MNILYTICGLLGGLGAFLIGVKLLSDNIEKLATKKLRKLFHKTTNNKLIGVGIGTATTAIVQSSSTTTVMVVGLVNAGVMTLMQATSIMMGANIGTTITAHIAALGAFDFAGIAVSLTAIGIFMNLFSKNEKTKIIGESIAGLGLIFIGLELMSASMSEVKSSPVITDILSSLNNPLMLLLAGAIITAVIQSSSASSSILISMVNAGIVIGTNGNAPLFIILGTNIGTCVTALLSSVGTSANGRRAGLIHLFFNVFGCLVWFFVLLLWPSFNEVVLASLFAETATQIAMFHTLFNVVCVAIFLPLSSWFVKLATLCVKDGKTKKKTAPLLDKRLLSSPAVAINSVKVELNKILDKSIKVLHTSYNDFANGNDDNTTAIQKEIDKIEVIGHEISDYLVNISSQNITHDDEAKVNQLHSNIADIVRIAEIADNIIKYTHRLLKDQLSFSPSVLSQMEEMLGKIDQLAEITKSALSGDSKKHIDEANEKENEIDKFRKKLVVDHIERLKDGTCRVENSRIFFNLVSNLERVGDHLNLIVSSIC